ncbi:MAG TPA: hypothetical protein VL400_25430, partial [Polyangiaceae bacterium]|nr:hypothetical protein [Polyangiaceae bacterium]
AGPVQQAFARHVADPFVVMRPVPLALPPGGAVSLLLAEEESLVMALAPVAPSTVHVEADLAGTFPSTAEENFRQLVVSLAQSTMGTALGLRSALGSLHVTAEEHAVTVAADFDAQELARGLSLLFRAEIADVLADPTDPGIGDRAETASGTTN